MESRFSQMAVSKVQALKEKLDEKEKKRLMEEAKKKMLEEEVAKPVFIVSKNKNMLGK